MALNVGELFGLLSLDDSPFNEALAAAENTFQSAGDKMMSVGKDLTKKVTVPIFGAGIAAFKFSNDMNEAMANVATLIPGNTKRVEELKGVVQDLAVDSGKGTGDIAEGLYNVVSAFGDSADTAEILAINTKNAVAGVATVTDSINLTSAVTKGYGDTSKKAVQQVSDLAFQTVKLGQTTFPELAQSIGKVTPLAASLGVKQEELFGVMATGTGVTGTAAEVSTQLRGVLQSLMSPTKTTSKLIEDMGYKSGAAMLEQEGLQGTMNLLVDEAEKSGKPLQEFISSIEGQTLALALTGPQADKFTEKLGEMKDTTGLVDEAFKEQTEGVNEAGFSMQQAGQKAMVLAQNVGDTLAPIIIDLLDNYISPLVDKFLEMDQSQQQNILKILGLIAVIGPLLLILGGLASGISAVISAFQFGLTIFALVKTAFITLNGVVTVLTGGVGILGTAITFLTSPIGIAIVAITAIIAIIVLLYKKSDTAREIIQGVGRAIKQIFLDMFEAIKQYAIGFMTYIGGWLKILKGLFTGDFELIKEGVGDIFEGMWDMLGGIVKLAFSWLSGPLDVLGIDIKGWFDGLIESAKKWGSNLISGFADGMKGAYNDVKNAAAGAIEKAKGWLGFNSPAKKGEGRHIVEWGANMIDGFLDGVKSMNPKVSADMASVMEGIKPKLTASISNDNNSSGLESILNQLSKISVGSDNQPIIKVYVGNEEFNNYIVDTANTGIQERKNISARARGIR